MMSYINETDFVIENKKLVYPEIVADGLQLYYDAKGKRDTDYHRDTMLDMSGNKNHGKLHNFAYEKHSGYKDGLVFDYIDDKLIRPTLNLKPNDFTFMLNGNIISFSPDGTVKRVQDGEVIESKGFNLVRNGDFRDGLAGWSVIAGTLSLTETEYNSFPNSFYKPTPTDALYRDVSLPNNHIIYLSAFVKGTNKMELRMHQYKTWTRIKVVTIESSDEWTLLSLTGLSNNGGIRIDTSVSDGENYYDDFIVIDLTETFGAGNEPTKEQMDEIINRFGYIPNAQDLIDHIEYKGNDLGDMENIIDGLYKTEVLSGEEIYTDKAGDDAGVHVEVDGKSYQQVDSSNLFNPSSSYYTNGINPGLVSWELNLKPNTIYTASTNMPDNNGTTKNVFFHIKDTVASSGLNGFSDNKPFSLTTSSTGIVEVTTRLLQYSGNIETIKNRDHWIKVEEGESATPFQGYPAPTPDYPIEIHSLNDFDVVSSAGGRNLLRLESRKELTETVYVSSSHQKYKENIVEFDIINRIASSGYMGLINYGTGYKLPEEVRGNTIAIKIHEDYPGEGKITISEHSYDGSHLRQRWVGAGITDQTLTINEDSYITFIIFDKDLVDFADRTTVTYDNYSNQYTPAPEDITEDSNHPYIDKINLLLDEPLRSVGDVKDRLFRDNDGVWKIERRIWVQVLDKNTTLNSSGAVSYEGTLSTNRYITPSKYSLGYSTAMYELCTHLPHKNQVWSNDDFLFGTSVNGATQFHFRIPNSLTGVIPGDSIGTRSSKISDWLESEKNKGNPFTIQYIMRDPEIEILPQTLQDSLNNLRSFEDSNYVYTVLPNEDNYLSDNLKPTLHAKFLYNNWYKEDRVINNLMIYNRALTNEEMLQNYKTIKRRWGM